MQSWSPKLATQLLEELVASGGVMLKPKVCWRVPTRIYVNIPLVRRVNFDMQTWPLPVMKSIQCPIVKKYR